MTQDLEPPPAGLSACGSGPATVIPGHTVTPRQGAGYENQDLDLGPDSPGCRRHGLGPPNTQPQWAKVSTVTMTVSVPLRTAGPRVRSVQLAPKRDEFSLDIIKFGVEIFYEFFSTHYY